VIAAARGIEIADIDRVEIAVEPWVWAFTERRRAEINRHFADRQRQQPALWNGRVLLLNRYAVSGGAMRGACFETDYASFLAFRDWDFPDPNVFNIFASAALKSADGAFLVGRMAATTASAGAIYFPCGTPDRDDVSPIGTLDIAGSLARELLEETGLDVRAFAADPCWTLVRDRGFVALMKQLTARESAETLRGRIMRYLAEQKEPEFSDIRIVRGAADFDPAMPRFLVAYLEKALR
jgi:8-oxo-dGTP pyrophosphatase MutT (NUDIX family)